MQKYRTSTRSMQGVALIQVLLLTGVISILLIMMMTYAQQHVAQAQRVQDQLEARFELYSQSNELMFTLLTHRWLTNYDQEATNNEWARSWNFYGKSFAVNNTEVKLYNSQSLVNPNVNRSGLNALLALTGVGEPDAEQLAQAAIDAGPYQHPRELMFVSGWQQINVQAFEKWLTFYTNVTQNPFNLPSPLLSLAVTPAQSDILRGMREEDNYNYDLFSRTTGIFQDEFVVFAPGNIFRIELSRTIAEFSVHRKVEFRVQPTSEVPILVFSEQSG